MLTVDKICGRCTFTATYVSVPARRALYTCANDAAATGCSEISSKNSPRGPPSSRSIVAIAVAVSNGFTASCKMASSSSAAWGRTSGRTLIICPALMYVGPSFSMITRASRARDRSFLLSSSAPPVMLRVATRVRKGTERPRNSAQRFCKAPPCFAQYAWIAARSYTSGRPSSSSATSDASRSASALPLATKDFVVSSGASTPRMRTALLTSTAATAALPATSPTFATSMTPPRRANASDAPPRARRGAPLGEARRGETRNGETARPRDARDAPRGGRNRGVEEAGARAPSAASGAIGPRVRGVRAAVTPPRRGGGCEARAKV